MSLGWGMAAMAAMNYLSSQQQSKAARDASKPLPTYYQEYQSPQQKEMYGQMLPSIQNMYGDNMPQMQEGPTAGWYSGLDKNVRAGIEEPYTRAMDMMRNQLGGGGMLGNQRAGMSGAAADVYGQYMQQAAPAMAQTGWNMMQPNMQANFNAQMFPYQALPSMLPQTYSDLLVGHHPTMQQIEPGAPMPPEYETLLTGLREKQDLTLNPSTEQDDWWTGWK